MRSALTAMAAALLVGVAGGAWAQEPGNPGTTRENRGRFLGLDVFVGGAAYALENPPRNEEGEVEDAWGKYGWDAGATLTVGPAWLGITGTLGSHPVENVSIFHVLAGPRLTTGWAVAELAGRGFAHALVGVARTSAANTSQTGGELVLGAGMDIMFFRIQGDYVRLNVPGVPKNNQRIFVGAVVPMCFRGCRENDWLNLSGRRNGK